MLLLTSTSDLVRVTAGSSADIEVHASWADNNAGVITPGRTNTASITGTSPTTIVAAPASSVQRNVRLISIRNNHASQASTLLVEHSDGTNVLSLIQVTLLAGEVLVMDDFGRWRHYSTDGGNYSVGVAGTTPAMATRAQMEAATATEFAVSPALQHHHPGHPKCWARFGFGADLHAGYNVVSVADTGAGRATVTIGNDFSSANWCCQAGLERPATAVTVTSLKYVNIRNASQAAGTVEIECYDGTATTHVQEDPQTYHFCGLGTLV